MNQNTLLRYGLGSTLLLASLFAGDVNAQASAPDYLEHFVYPRNGAAASDEIFVLYADNCGRPHPEARATDVVRNGDRIEVDLYLQEPESPICPAVFLPDELHRVSLGRLPRGNYQVVRRLHVRAFGGSQYRLELESHDAISIGDAPNPAASGTWYDLQAPGLGMVLNLLPAASGAERGDALIFLATRRTTGESVWMSGMGHFVDGVLSVPLRRAETPTGVAADATATFTYLGCGAGTLRVSDTSLQFPLGTAALQQLTKSDGLLDCRPPALRPDSLD